MQELEKKREKQAQAKAKKRARSLAPAQSENDEASPTLEDMTQRVVSDYIRERDYDLPCISCGTFDTVQWGSWPLPLPRESVSPALQRGQHSQAVPSLQRADQGTSSSTASLW